MQVAQIELAQRVIRLEPGTTKNREGREVVMTDAVYTLLSACIHGKRADDHVFTRSNGKRVRDFRVTWENACKAAGVPETVIMKIGGWRTRSVFERYAIVSRNDIADAMLQLQQNEKANEQQNGHIIGHSETPAQMGALPHTVN
jgi:hypothetical protein